MSKLNLRPYQIDLKDKIYSAWQSGMKNILAVSPTGSGKAFTLCTLAEELAYTHGMPTVIKVHRKELVSQLCNSLATLGVTHNIIAQKQTVLDIMSDQKRIHGKSFYNPRSPITVISVDTLLARYERYKDWAVNQRVWILDEAAHQLKDNKWGKCADMFPNAIGVGFTATPQRLDKKGLGRHAFGLFDHMVIGPTVRWLIDNGFLSRYKVIVPKSDYREYLKDDGSTTKDYSAKAREYASLHSHIIGDVVDNYIKFINGLQTIVFADSIQAAERMEQEFNTRGIPAKLLTGNTPNRERAMGVRSFADNTIKVLINVDLFDEGFDIMSTPGKRIVDAVIMARPTKSVSKYLQQAGRALRPHKDKPFAYIIDHVGNIAYHGLPDKIRPWTLDNIVKKRDSTTLHRLCMNVECTLPFDRWLDACPFCGNTDKPYTRDRSNTSAREALKIVDGDMELLDPETLRELETAIDLENPFELEARVRVSVGDKAAISARRKQEQRIRTQKELADTIALWAGKERARGFTDRQIKKRFMMNFGEGITVTLSLPRAEMQDYIEMIKGDLS